MNRPGVEEVEAVPLTLTRPILFVPQTESCVEGVGIHPFTGFHSSYSVETSS